jgi:hypothetical protein
MRRRSTLALVAVLVVIAIVSTRYVSLRNQAARRTAAGEPRDSVARLDSAARADARQDADTMCFASRIGLPCDPR